MTTSQAARRTGLDILRAVAIMLVVFVHCSDLLSPILPDLNWLPDGVDLFFVLSGFLVGGILIRGIREDGGLDWKGLKVFLKRRWFRTLPNYFLFLLVHIVLVYFGLLQGQLNKYLITYFFFLQNLYVPFDFLFWESWSLSVEEWFYLSFPLLLFIGFKLKRIKTKDLLFLLILVFILVPLAYRISKGDGATDMDHWDLYFRKLVFTRLDSIGFGLLAAFLCSYFPASWHRFRNLAFAMGIAGLFFLGAIPFSPGTFFFKTFYFSGTSLFVALLLPRLNSTAVEKIPGKPFSFISRISYAMYFCNAPLIALVKHFFHPDSRAESVAVFLLCWLVIICISWLLYTFFEYPLTNLRDRKKVNR
jgi:peptidoglycan/LPS O-acetylase OafA/YrhL